MKVNDVYQSESNFLKADDLPKGTRVGVIISGCELHEFKQEDGSKQKKMVLSFDGKEKKLTLNVTNARMIAANLGSDDTDDWIGKKVVLYNDPNVQFAGKITGGIRIRKPKQQPAKLAVEKAQELEKKQTAKSKTIDDLDDDIPF